MSTFETRITDLVGALNPADTVALTDWLTDEAKTIWGLLPTSALEQNTEIAAVTDGTALDISDKKMLEVTRYGYQCRKVNYGSYRQITNPDSMHYATEFSPVWFTLDGDAYIVPTPESAKAGMFLYSRAPAVAYNDTAIANFPPQAEALVVLGAAIRTRIRQLLDKRGNLPETFSLTVSHPTEEPSLVTVSYTPVSADVDSDTVLVTSVDVTAGGTAPTYIQPVLSLNTLTVTDLTISCIPPVAPSVDLNTITAFGTAPAYTAPVYAIEAKPTIADLSISSVAPVAPVLTDNTVDTSGLSNPTFVAPVMTAPNWTDVETWITTEEDSEMSAARIQAINAQIQEFSTKLGESQSQFNKENEILQKDLQVAIQNAQLASSDDGQKLQKYSSELQAYQSNVNKELQEYQQNFQKDLSLWEGNNSAGLSKYQADIQNQLNVFNDANVEYQAAIQKNIQEGQLAESEEGRKLQKYGSELQSYQYQVNKEVQEYQVNTQKDVEIWSTTRQTELQKYQADMQNELNTFNEENIAFQEAVQRSLQNANAENQKYLQQAQADLQRAIADANRSQERQVQNAINTMQAIIADNNAEIANYQALISGYGAEISAEVQEFTQQLQQVLAEHGVMRQELEDLQGRYNIGLQALVGNTGEVNG